MDMRFVINSIIYLYFVSLVIFSFSLLLCFCCPIITVKKKIIMFLHLDIPYFRYSLLLFSVYSSALRQRGRCLKGRGWMEQGMMASPSRDLGRQIPVEMYA